MNEFRILVVDDHPLNLDVTERVILKCNATPILSDSGRNAIDIYTKSEVDYFNLILMDLNMPELDGVETIKEIRNLNRIDSKNIPIYIVSGDSNRVRNDETVNGMIQGFIDKPIDRELINIIINKYRN